MTQPAESVSAPIVKRGGGWATDFTSRLLGNDKPTTTTTTAPTISHGRAFARAIGDVGTVGITSGLLGAAHAKGMLDAGRAAVDGLLALLGIGAGIASAPWSPGFSRFTTNVGLAGTASLLFRKGFELAAGRPMSTRTSQAEVEDIASVAEEL